MELRNRFWGRKKSLGLEPRSCGEKSNVSHIYNLIFSSNHVKKIKRNR